MALKFYKKRKKTNLRFSYLLGIIIIGMVLVISSQDVFAKTPDPINPGVAMKICSDDPAFISNVEGDIYETPLDLFLYWCPEEYDGYSATTRFAVLINAPSWNTNPDKVDHIGNTAENAITIYTNEGKANLAGTDAFGFPCTGFSELGTNTGLFEGLVLLTGFPHDYDGDGIIDTPPPLWGFSDCGSQSAFGELQSAAFLQTKRQGGITVAWEVTDNFSLVKSATYSFRVAEVSFDKKVYSIDDTVTVLMHDLDYMLFDEYRQPWIVRVWSDSDVAGINLRVSWEEDFTYTTPFFKQADFYGRFYLTDIDESQFDNRLRVSPGDNIYVDFDDYTLLYPYGEGDYITVSDSAKVVFSDENISGITLNSVIPTNYQGETFDEIEIGGNIQIQAQVENHTPYPKTVSCILSIKNSEGIFENISWAQMNLESRSVTEINQSWRPNAEGNYTATIHVWEQITNGRPLTDTKEVSFTVLG